MSQFIIYKDGRKPIERPGEIASRDELIKNISAYKQTDQTDIYDYVCTKYDSKGKISPIYQRFFKNFINSKANCYKNYFERVVSGNDIALIDWDALNLAFETAERYMHISNESIIYVKSLNEFIVYDASQYKQVGDNYYITTDKGSFVIKSDGVYQLTNQKIDNSEQSNYVEELLYQTPISPIIKFSVGIPVQFNSLVQLEWDFIADLSWGVYNAGPKLLSQYIVSSDEDADKLKQSVGNLGRTTKVVKTSVNDKISMIETGDLNNLKDLVGVYNDLVKQAAVSQGVDKNGVNLMTFFESGIAKIVELSYVNDKRKEYFRIYKMAEKKMYEVLSRLFGIKIGLVLLKFYPIQFFETVPDDYVESVTLTESEYQQFLLKKNNKITESQKTEEKKTQQPTEPQNNPE